MERMRLLADGGLTSNNGTSLIVFMIGGVLAVWANKPAGRALLAVSQPTARLRGRATTFKLMYARFVLLLFGSFSAGVCAAGLTGILEPPPGMASPVSQVVTGACGGVLLVVGLVIRGTAFTRDVGDAVRSR